MSNGNTKYKKTYNLKATIFSIIFLAIIVVVTVYLLLNADNFLQVIVCLFLLAFIFIGLISIIIGIIKAKIQIAKENKYVKDTNPYIYYRELPNNFGIGVTTLLIDSTIENYKDIVAVILDLCARKYIKLIKQNDKYIIQILKPVDDNLLSNEKYILTLITNKNIKNIDYKEWYKYCMQDGINLGLYYHKEINIDNGFINPQEIAKKKIRQHVSISVIVGIIIAILSLFGMDMIELIKYGLFEFITTIMYKYISTFIITFILTYVVLIVPFYFIILFAGIKNIMKKVKNTNYKDIIENNLPKTEKGIEELHKLYSLKAFINDFGNFVDKKADEVVIWDRYLSYAQVFGLTKEIMSSGYKELVENASFQIDNIDNINLNNIEVNSN